MRSKVQWASAVALLATMMTALFSTQGAGALAQELAPVPATPNSPVFVSRPVIQAAPVAPAADASAGMDEAQADGGEADSLFELVADQAIPETLTSELNCLAGAIYFEARGETLPGQLAVGRVIVNRAGSGRFPSSYCGVVYQRSQFSFVRGGAMPAIRKDTRQWRNAVAIAQIAHAGSWKSPAQGALYFHAARVSPGWRHTRLARVDNHVFYR